jgi:putative hydrolase of the HAD superfamily
LEIKVRGVLLDLWGTLVYNIPRLKREDYDELARRIGQPTEEIWKRWRAYSNASLRGEIKSGKERASRILTELGAPLELAPELAEFEFEMRSADVHFFPGVPEMLAELRQRGYRTCLISNCNYLTPQVVEKMELSKLLDGVVLSCLVGLVKPDLEIYRLGASRIGLEPADCLFVGDGGDGELDGARAAGCRVALVAQERGHAFRNPSKLYPYDIRLANINELLNYLKEPAEASTAA